MASNIEKTFIPNSKDIRYINRDFSQLKEDLIGFAKTYYPNTYKDFSPSSPGMMFIEQAAYVGDILSYYTDYAFKESILESSTDRKNILNLANYLGYKTKAANGSHGNITIYQLCPSKTDGVGNYFPDEDYMLGIKENSQFSSNNNIYFILENLVDFKINTPLSPRTDIVYSRDENGNPSFFLLSKSGKIKNGQILTKTVTVTDPVSFLKINLDELNVIDVLDIVDSDNNRWYKVDYLAQETVPLSEINNSDYIGFSQYRDSSPYILKYIKTSRRYITSVNEGNITSIQFGAGIDGMGDELVTFDSNLIGAGLSNFANLNVPLDPNNFLKNRTYGIAPKNTTLTIRYIIGGGIESNCAIDTVTNIVSIQFDNPTIGLTPEKIDLLNTVKNSIRITNDDACVGGRGAETDDEIKANAIAFFAAQNRAVTKNDYIARIYSLPGQFGSIAKAYIVSDSDISSNNNSLITTPSNPFLINTYILSYDQNKNLVKPSDALVSNLITYLNRYKVVTDRINIIDGYIINIGVDFSIVTYNGYNKKDVLLNCISAVKEFFKIDNWDFNQPININQLQLEIARIEGVQSIGYIKIINKTSMDGNYSDVQYDIMSATKNGIIYPSADISIFELKYPDIDVKGSCV